MLNTARYCSNLATDQLSVLTPIVWWTKEVGGFRVYIRCPPNAVVKQIEVGLQVSTVVLLVSHHDSS
jgi:hypothetical protein